MLDKFGLVPTKSKSVKVGQKFGRLEVVDIGQVFGTYRYYAVCRCDCGTVLKIRFDSLSSKATTSCGCAHRDIVTTHGLTGTLHYDRWQHMMSRCFDEKNAAYHRYGGRGITVCEAWRDPAVFANSLPDGYWDGAEMDRIDNDGNYEPGNIKWSTPKQNSNNRRSTTAIEFMGEMKTQREWSSVTGIDERIIHSRIHKLGWSVEKALTTPVMNVDDVARKAITTRWEGHEKKGRPAPKTGRRLKIVEYQGEVFTMSQLSKVTGLSARTLYRRIFEQNIPVDIAVK